MAKASLLSFLICVIAVCDQTYGFGKYYWQNYQDGQDLANFAPVSAVIEPECDNSKEGKKGSSDSSSSESSSSKSSEESSSESKEGESSSSSEESKSSSEEGGEPGNKEGAKAGKEGSKEEKSSEASGEESKEKKREVHPVHKKKKSKESRSAVPSKSYNFPSRQVQQIVYSAAAPYAYLPYRSSYVLQQPVASYPLKSHYQYVSMPSSAAIVNPYRPQVVSRIVSSPVTRIIYSPEAVPAVPAVSKAIVTPGSQVYSAPVSWSAPISYYKK